MRKYMMALVGIFIILLSLVFILTCMVMYNSKYNTAQETAEENRRRFYERTIKFKFKDETVSVPMFEVSSYDILIEMPNLFDSLFNVPTINIMIDWNKDKLKKTIDADAVFQPEFFCKHLYLEKTKCLQKNSG